MLHILPTAPLHIQWILCLLIASFALSLLVGICGAVCRRLWQDRLLPISPMYRGSTFPTCWDIGYTILFFAYYISGYGDSSPMPEQLNQHNAMLAALIFTALVYLPMVLRLALLPVEREDTLCEPTAHGSRLKRDLLLVAGALFTIITFSSLYELSGLMKLIIHATDCPEHQEIVQAFLQGDTQVRVYICLAAVIFAPIGEECCFRGFMYSSLRKYAGPVWAAVCTSLLFAAVHMSLASVLPLFIFAVVQCVLYEKTRSLRAPILTHALFNALEIGFIFLFPSHA